MKRKFFTVASAASLLLCIATTALWVRSYRVSDNYGMSQLSGVSTERGEFLIMVAKPDWNFYFVRGYRRERLPAPDDAWNPRRDASRTWNLILAHGEQFPGLSITVVKLWAVAVLLACPPVLVLGRRLFRGTWHHSICRHCGYNLTANTSGVCPECGTSVPQKSEAAA